jgi:predicted ribosome quality control (RQC) complex YloA/Tae2 family protein
MNGIYLKLLLAEIRSEVSGRYIDEICIKQRLLQIIMGKQALFISLYPEMLALYLSKSIRSGFDKLGKFSQPVAGSRINSIAQSDFMPVLRLNIERNDAKLILSFYHEAPNFIIETEKFTKKLYPRYLEKKSKRSILDIAENELQDIYAKQSKEFPEFLLQEFEGFDKNLAKELTLPRISYLKKVLLTGKTTCRLVSVNPLRISFFAANFIKEYCSLNRLYEYAFGQFNVLKDSELDAARKSARMRTVRRQITRLKKKILSNDEIESYRIKGEFILTNIAKVEKGSKQLAVKDPYKDKEIIIMLDPIMTPQENAQHYFAEYKKIKRGMPKLKHEIDRLKKELEKLKDPGFKLPILLKSQCEKTTRAEPYRTFKLASGALVYVGKNARSNNELTFAFARPNDYFFHIRNYEGAHVILKVKIPRGQRPNKRDLEETAAIAAYFSKAKTQKNVPVSYTQRKYLKRNKKGKPGSVILMREDVIFIDPGLPTGPGP